MKKIIKLLFIFIITFFVNVSIFNVTLKGATINSSEDFLIELQKQTSVIMVGDIDFQDKTIIINYNVTIVGSKSKLSRVYFKTMNPGNGSDLINIKFSNIEFDGGFSIDSNELVNESLNNREFEEIFSSERNEYRCMDFSEGYYNLELDHCYIHNYASLIGPALFVENNYRENHKNITINNCDFSDNYSMYDTIHLSNDLLSVDINGCEFSNNYGYKGLGFSIANSLISIKDTNVHDNHFVPYDVNQNDAQLCGGGIYLGGCKGLVENVTIKNNETIYGGGLGIASSKSGDGGIGLYNLVIENNKAKHGGAVACHSLIGQPITFISSLFKNNSSVEGSSFYTLVYAFFNPNNSGGLVNIFFSSFINNTANDENTFSFYHKDDTKGELGIIDVKGCFIIGNDKYLGDNTYNYQNTVELAKADKVYNDSDYPVEGSTLNIKKSEYSSWSEYLNGYKGSLHIGYGNIQDSNKSSIIILIILIILVSVLTPIIVIFVIRKRRNIKYEDNVNVDNASNENNQDDLNNDNNEKTDDSFDSSLDILTERELSVAYYTVNLKKRKEIAEIINYSEETVKKDLSSVYLKLNVKEKSELIVKYGSKISEYFEKKLSI
ncbi:MAG: hypothetical protein IJS58_09110 [Bacilli bacterium]|nr:hypothetical protein [Bacilli bacterium]